MHRGPAIFGSLIRTNRVNTEKNGGRWHGALSALKTPAGKANRGSRYTEPSYKDYFPAVLLEAGAVLFLCDLCVVLVPDFAL